MDSFDNNKHQEFLIANQAVDNQIMKELRLSAIDHDLEAMNKSNVENNK